MIAPNGYNVGRDSLVQSAITGSSWKGISWVTDVEWREGLLEPGFKGIDCVWFNILPCLLTLSVEESIMPSHKMAVSRS